ncbi:ImuA family protein [Sphingopyxis sp.]|uniref:ImuA family protein n=1 Tax=Sphingopyxis sp. TaxID=1908224 RepID=UPI003BAB308F
MRESSPSLAGLRKRIARLAADGGPVSRSAEGWLASGDAGFDTALGGGLAIGRVHEFFAADALDATSAAAFAALLALRAPGKGPLIWLRTADAANRTGHIYAPGIAELGGDPDQLLIVETPDPKMLLACANDAIRCAGSAAVIVESWGKFPLLDLTAGRRLTLGARDAGTTLLMLRLNAAPAPSVAETRWSVGGASSHAIEANAPGAPAFDLELLRWRAGPAGGRWRLDWNHDDKSFGHALGEPTLSGALLPLAARRAALPHGAAAA